MSAARKGEAALLCAVFLDLLGFGMVLTDIQLRAEQLSPKGVPPGPIVGTLLATTFVVQFLVSPRWGALSDRRGRKGVLIGCTLFSAAGMATYGLAHGLAMLFLSRFLSGLGGANVAIAQAAVSDIEEGPARTAALGRVAAAISLGLIVGPPVGGLLARIGDNLLLGFAAASASLLGAGLIGAFVPVAPPRDPAPRPRPLIFDVRLLNDYPRLKPLAVIAVVSWFSLATLEGTFLRLIHADLGFDQRHFGVIFGYESALGFYVSGALLSSLTARFRNERRLLAAAYALQGVGLALNPAAALVIGFVPRMGLLLVASTLYAFGSGVASPTVSSLCSRLVPDGRQGELFGLLQGTRSIGFMFGPIIGGALFEMAPGLPYLLAGFVCLAAALLVLRLTSSEAPR